MSFASLTFVLFCIAVFALYYARSSRVWQNWVLIAASYFFYGWWDYRFCSLMLISSVVDYWAGAAIDPSSNPAFRKGVLAISICCNLGMLGFFKYYNFFIENLAALADMIGLPFHAGTLRIVLPVGISFYTFQTMSYTIDIYRGGFRPARDFAAYVAFVSFFPQLVAGPIERASHLLPQFISVRRFDPSRAWLGMRLIIWGLFKKMVIADNLAAVADAVYQTPGTWSGPALLLGTVAFAFQIYTDFSAYSDIAAGTAHLFGIDLMRNFAYPYFAQSVAEFWRRWHISLSTWFRDYVYIPLGGSRASLARTRVNVMLTFVLSGFWHGASWNFIIWGALNGLGMLVDTVGRKRNKRGPSQVPGGDGAWPHPGVVLRILGTFFFMCLTWVFFRAATLGDAVLILKSFCSMSRGWEMAQTLYVQHRLVFLMLPTFILTEWVQRGTWNVLALKGVRESWMALVFATSFFLMPFCDAWIGYGLIVPGWACGCMLEKVSPPLMADRLGHVFRWLFFTALVWLILYFGTFTRGAFIYFQF